MSPQQKQSWLTGRCELWMGWDIVWRTEEVREGLCLERGMCPDMPESKRNTFRWQDRYSGIDASSGQGGQSLPSSHSFAPWRRRNLWSFGVTRYFSESLRLGILLAPSRLAAEPWICKVEWPNSPLWKLNDPDELRINQSSVGPFVVPFAFVSSLKAVKVFDVIRRNSIREGREGGRGKRKLPLQPQLNWNYCPPIIWPTSACCTTAATIQFFVTSIQVFSGGRRNLASQWVEHVGLASTVDSIDEGAVDLRFNSGGPTWIRPFSWHELFLNVLISVFNWH